MLMEGSQGSPRIGRPLARPAVRTTACRRRAPDPLALSCLRRCSYSRQIASQRVAHFRENSTLVADEIPGKVSVSRFDEPLEVAGQH